MSSGYITEQDIFEATSGGLDIILQCYPQAREVLSNSNKHFKIRKEERTPSASLKQLNNGIWVVTDFGGDQVPRNGIHVYQKEEGLSFRESLLKLAEIYNIGGIRQEINKPHIHKRAATGEEKEGEYYFDKKEEIPGSALKVLGPKVTHEACKRFNLFALNSFTHIKNGEALIVSATDNFPIFLFDYGDFQKLYQPLNPEKKYRFRYFGNKPGNFVYGLTQLITAHKKYCDAKSKELSEEEDKKFESIKLDAAIICSGERDALNVAGYGYYPLWLNSETAELPADKHREIMNCVHTLYNLPDIDDTGIRAAVKLGLKYLDIRHIMLPDFLRSFKDPRGNSRKDFLDYIEIYPSPRNVRKLINVAKPMRFWDSYSPKKGIIKYRINSANLLFFLQSNGFFQMENKNTKSGLMFVKIEGHIVRAIQQKDIKGFLIRFCEENYLPNEILELVLNTTRLSETVLQGLKPIELNFTDYELDAQYLFFTNKVWKVTKNEIAESLPESSVRYVWEDEVIDHKIRKLDDFFEVKTDKSRNIYDINIYDTPSKYFKYLINASRIYWRKELEIALLGLSKEKQEEYKKNNQFSIDGDLLTEDEIYEQKMHLINKMYAIGYLLHRYKTPSKAWAVYATDNIIGEEGENNGRSGKSFGYKVLRHLMKSITLSGRNKKLTDNSHLYDRVTEHTDLILVDDADPYLDYKFFFDSITGELVVNPKNNQSYEIPFERSPKFCFTSNHALPNPDPSLTARILYTVYADYYHEKTENNDYLETRKIRDDFGKDLFGPEYTEEEWNADLNFFAQCIRFYLSVSSSLKIDPPMLNVNRRSLMAEMGQAFKDWADAYFDIHGGNTDKMITKEDALNDFMQMTNVKKWSTTKFTKALKAFCKFNNYNYNPKEFHNSQGRISKKIDGTTKEMIYIQVTNISDFVDFEDVNPNENKEHQLPF